MLCMSCKFGNECPYIEGTDDMLHALFPCEDDKLDKLREQVDSGLEKMATRIKEVYKVSRSFDLGIDLSQCGGYESDEKVDWEAGERLHMLVMVLYEFAGDCRSKVGVRIPFRAFDEVVAYLERYLNILVSGKGVISTN